MLTGLLIFPIRFLISELQLAAMASSSAEPKVQTSTESADRIEEKQARNIFLSVVVVTYQMCMQNLFWPKHMSFKLNNIDESVQTLQISFCIIHLPFALIFAVSYGHL